MAIAKRCDRCGCFYEQYNVGNSPTKINGFMTLNIDSGQQYYSHGAYDLCPKCSGELMSWFNTKGENNNAEN